MRSNYDSDWRVHSLILSIHDLRGLPLRRLGYHLLFPLVCFCSVSSQQTWPNHDNLQRLTVDNKSIRRQHLPDEWFGGVASRLERPQNDNYQGGRNKKADGVPDECREPEIDRTNSGHQLRMFRFDGAFRDNEDDERRNEETHSDRDAQREQQTFSKKTNHSCRGNSQNFLN